MEPSMSALIGLIIGSVLIGVFAQREKGRTGAGWAALTFLIGVAWWLFFEIALTLAGSSGDEFRAAWEELRDTLARRALVYERELWVPLVAPLIAGVYFAGLPTALMAIVVWTLPERRPAHSDTKEMPQPGPPTEWNSERLPCPLCAEAILPAAKVCPYCRSELPVDWANHGSFQ